MGVPKPVSLGLLAKLAQLPIRPLCERLHAGFGEALSCPQAMLFANLSQLGSDIHESREAVNTANSDNLASVFGICRALLSTRLAEVTRQVSEATEESSACLGSHLNHSSQRSAGETAF